jgi:hypothetical protein
MQELVLAAAQVSPADKHARLAAGRSSTFALHCQQAQPQLLHCTQHVQHAASLLNTLITFINK